MVPKGNVSRICFERSVLPINFPVEFAVVLMLRRTLTSQELEAGSSSPIVANFLAFAVESARKIFNNERLVVHPEVQIPYVQIPDVGLVGGTLDL